MDEVLFVRLTRIWMPLWIMAAAWAVVAYVTIRRYMKEWPE